MFEKMIQRKMMRALAPKLEMIIQALMDKAKTIPLQGDESLVAAQIMELEGEVWFVLVTLKKDGKSISRVLIKHSIRDIIHGDVLEGLKIDELGLDENDINEITQLI